MRRLFLSFGLLAIASFHPATVSAQGFGGSGMGGMGSGMGGGMGGSSGMGGFGSSSGMGGFGSSSGMGGFGSSSGSGGFGSSSSGMGGMGGMGSSSGMGGMGGQNQQGGAFLGRNTNQQGFLGRNAQATGQQGMNGQNMNQNGNRGGNRGNVNTFSNMMNQGNNASGSGNQIPLVRPRQKVAFDYPIPKAEVLQTKLSTHVTRVSVRRPELKNVAIAMNAGGEAVLTGTVKSQADSKLAENLMRLEPGVRSIKNELTFPLPDAE